MATIGIISFAVEWFVSRSSVRFWKKRFRLTVQSFLGTSTVIDYIYTLFRRWYSAVHSPRQNSRRNHTLIPLRARHRQFRNGVNSTETNFWCFRDSSHSQRCRSFSRTVLAYSIHSFLFVHLMEAIEAQSAMQFCFWCSRASMQCCPLTRRNFTLFAHFNKFSFEWNSMSLPPVTLGLCHSRPKCSLENAEFLLLFYFSE